MDSTARYLIAVRIDHALQRFLGGGIDVESMEESENYAREVLYVCAGSGDPELQALGEQYLGASRPAHPPRGAPQDTAWARNTSGFGYTRPAELDAPPQKPPQRSGWLNPARWLRRDPPRDR